MTTKNPCYMCENRHIGCHGSCSRYAEFRKICEERSAQRELEYAANGVIWTKTRRKKVMGKRGGM